MHELGLTLGCTTQHIPKSCPFEDVILVQHVKAMLLHLVMAVFTDQASSHTGHVTYITYIGVCLS